MELKNSLLDKVKNENSLHSTTQNEFNEIRNIIPKLNKENQYWALYNEISKLIENDSFDNLQKASVLLSEREFNYIHSFKKSSQTILEPNNDNYYKENTTFLKYLKKQLFFQNNFKKVKQHYDLYHKVNQLSNSISNFQRSNESSEKATFSSLKITIGSLIGSFIVYIGFLAISGDNVNSILNMIFAIIFFSALIVTVFSLYEVFFTKDGWRNISEHKNYTKNKSEYNRLNTNLSYLKKEINTVANNYPSYKKKSLKIEKYKYDIKVTIKKFFDFGIKVEEIESQKKGLLHIADIKDNGKDIEYVKRRLKIGDILFVRKKIVKNREENNYYSEL